MRENDIRKIELIRDGTFKRFLNAKKEQFNDGFEPDKDPSTYGVDEEAMTLLNALEKSTKRKKRDFRQHAAFMSEYYQNIGLLTLTFSSRAIEKSSFDRKKEAVTSILKTCFEDYIGMFEISPKGRLHAHLVVAWNGGTHPFTARREKAGKWQTVTLLKKDDLQELWFGERDENGQPTKYGHYDLAPITRSRTDTNKAVNYTMKTLNTIESYVTKEDLESIEADIDDDLIIAVNTSNILTARGTPYQRWKKDRAEQDRDLRRKARIFEGSFYDEHKYEPNYVFREWAESQRGELLTDYLKMFDDDFKIVQISDYKDG